MKLFAMLLGLSIAIYSQDANRTIPKAEKQTTRTGCLTKTETAGEYLLTEENTGAKLIVTGPAELDKHAANNRVRLTGTETKQDDKTVFEATKIEHLSQACAAPR